MTQSTEDNQLADGKEREWADLFLRWPADLPRSAAIITSFGEQITFRDFMTTESLLLVERRTPDVIGARQVIIPFRNIAAVKITEPVSMDIFSHAGFRGRAASQPRRKITPARSPAATSPPRTASPAVPRKE